MAHPFDGVVPPHAFLLRALADFDALTGWKSSCAGLKGTSARVEGVTLARDSDDLQFQQWGGHMRPLESVRTFLGLTRHMPGGPGSLIAPGRKHAPNGGLTADEIASNWPALSAAVEQHGSVILVWGGDRPSFELYYRSGVEAWAGLCGFTIAREVWLHPHACELWLAPTRKPSWLATAAEAARLLECLVKRVGGPATEVQLQAVPHQDWVPGQSQPPRTVTPTASTAWNDWRKASLSATFAAGPAAPRPEELLGELVLALARAHREAPRGYVGLAQFRDRLLLPRESKETRAAVLKEALDKGLARVVKQTDPVTKAVVTALELVPSHGLARGAAAPSPLEGDDRRSTPDVAAESEGEALDDGGVDVQAAPAGWDEDQSIEDYTEGWKHSD